VVGAALRGTYILKHQGQGPKGKARVADVPQDDL